MYSPYARYFVMAQSMFYSEIFMLGGRKNYPIKRMRREENSATNIKCNFE